jgi:CheY-like chemotaxis protein
LFCSAEEKLETILVVDDAYLVMNMVVLILEDAGFIVLEAHGGINAIEMAGHYQGKIDLLLCDVNMAGMSGPQLANLLKACRPDLHVMFMSGSPEKDLPILNYQWTLIQKPFVGRQLVAMVTAALAHGNHVAGMSEAQ